MQEIKSIAIHSHKGGVGKTLISINLAALLMRQGYNVCLLDADFSAPNLHTFFNVKTSNYVNRYINKEIKLEDCMHKIEFDQKVPGTLQVIFADPTSESINQMVHIDARTAGNMLQGLMQLKMKLRKPPFNIDYLILDTTPGIGLTTINSFVLTDNILFIIKLSNADIHGTVEMINGILEKLPARSMLIANQIPADKIDTPEKQKYLSNLVETELNSRSSGLNVEFLGSIATDDELQSLEFETAIASLSGEESKRVIYTLDKPDHVFARTMEEIAPKLFE
ncbi:MAG: MinD/ParA family protein [Candidatus Heimdallarchaeota archaeon]